MQRHRSLWALTLAAVPLAGSALAQTKPPPMPSSPSNSASVSLAASVAVRARLAASSFRRYEADFAQLDTFGAANLPTWSSGKLTFERAGKGAVHGDRMRWDYAVPSGDLVVSDGVRVWSYFASAKQAHARIPTGSHLPLVVSVLAGTIDLAKDFHLSILSSAPTLMLDAKPKVPTTAYVRLRIDFDTTALHCRRVVVIEANGNRHLFDFTSSRLNPSLRSTAFRWVPPRGVTIVP